MFAQVGASGHGEHVFCGWLFMDVYVQSVFVGCASVVGGTCFCRIPRSGNISSGSLSCEVDWVLVVCGIARVCLFVCFVARACTARVTMFAIQCRCRDPWVPRGRGAVILHAGVGLSQYFVFAFP